MIFDKEFKIALQNLPESEKDKLILRLLKKDLPLANQLLFQLVDTDTVEQKRAIVENELSKFLKKSANRFYSLGIFLMDMRYASGKINDHVSITKDKYGAISLNIQFLNESINYINMHLQNSKPNDHHTICTYIISRAFKILLLIKAQHEDMHLDFREAIEELGNRIGDSQELMKYAIYNGLDVNWLTKFEIPDNIVAIHKEIRANGFLK